MRILIPLYVILTFSSIFNAHQLIAQKDSRLLFSREDVEAIRLKKNAEPFASMYKVLQEKSRDPKNTEYEHAYFAINNSFLYTVTGESKYADSALAAVEYLVNLEDWARDEYRALGRAMYAKGVSLAYDMCKNAWPYETDTFISRKLVDMGASLRRSGGKGWPSGPGNNWRAVRYSAMGLCYLAADFIPDSLRESEVNHAFDEVVIYFNANLSEQEDAMGWNPEGIGYVVYPAEFWGIFNIAVNRLYPEKNLLYENIAVKHTLTTIYRGSILMNQTEGRRGYHPDFSDDNMSLYGSGVFGLAFRNIAEEYIPAMKWFYNRLVGPYGDGTFDNDRGGVMFSYLFYPDEIEEENPEEIFGLNYMDPPHGMVIYRNKFNDSTDIVAQHNAKGRAPKHCHGGADANGFRIWGLGSCWTTGAGRIGSKGSPGQTTVLRYDPSEQVPKSSETGKLTYHEFHEDGSGYSVIQGSSTLLPFHRRVFVSDLSGLSGSPGIFVISDSTVYGKYWRLNTPEVNSIEFSDSSFIITSPNGNSMHGIIFHGEDETIRKGVFERGSGFTWDGVNYGKNNWLDFQSENRDYLVVLILLEEGQSLPEIDYKVTEQGNYIFVGERMFKITGEAVSFMQKSDWQIPVNTSMNEINNLNLLVYPNPAEKSVQMQFFSEGSQLLNAYIYNEKGALISILYEGRLQPGVNEFFWTSGDAKGKYIVKYHMGNGLSRHKLFIIQ